MKSARWMIKLTSLIEKSHVCLVSPISTDVSCLICNWHWLLYWVSMFAHVDWTARLQILHVWSHRLYLCTCVNICAYLSVIWGTWECVWEIKKNKKKGMCVSVCAYVCLNSASTIWHFSNSCRLQPKCFSWLIPKLGQQVPTQNPSFPLWVYCCIYLNHNALHPAIHITLSNHPLFLHSVPYMSFVTWTYI